MQYASKIASAGFALLAVTFVTGCVSSGSNNVYFAAFLKHFDPNRRTNEGNMEYFAFSKDFEKDEWGFETGVNTYVDSYSQRSYSIFSRVSHERFRFKYITPVVSANCSYKGDSYNDDKMKVICTPPISLRIGAERGVFGYFTAVPKVGSLTNGLVMLELGYTFKPSLRQNQ